MRKINYNRPLISIQDICAFIDKGEKYLKGEFDNIEEILQAIILNPPYQRNYRSSQKEESSIIESIIMGVPIPEVFLIKVRNNEGQVRNVMDGKHRLNSIYRFVKNQYKLIGLKGDMESFNYKYFSDLDTNIKIKILTSHLSVLEFDPLESPEIEVDLFTRYNKNTKPLQKQEINYASYTSKTSDYVSSFILNELVSDGVLNEVYNVTKDRTQKQTLHQNIFTLLYILENGLKYNFSNSQNCSEEYMKQKSKIEQENLDQTKLMFDNFNILIKKLSEHFQYPFSNLIFSENSSRNYKFQIGIAMYIACVMHYFSVNLDSNTLFEDFNSIMMHSHIADKDYSGSSTSRLSMLKYLSTTNTSIYKSFNLRKDFPIID